MNYSKFYCTKCGQQGIPVQRNKGQKRQSGHLKKLWCVHCQQLINHVEIYEFSTYYTYEDFKLEREYGNFTEEGTRKETIGMFKANLRKEGIEDE